MLHILTDTAVSAVLWPENEVQVDHVDACAADAKQHFYSEITHKIQVLCVCKGNVNKHIEEIQVNAKFVEEKKHPHTNPNKQIC